MKLLLENWRKYLTEDEEQRSLRAKKSAHDPNHALPIIWKKFKKWGRDIPYSGRPTVRVFRAVSPEFGKEPIRPGDWVTLTREYAEVHAQETDRVVVQDEVNAEDVYWATTDENEFFYAPEGL